LFAATVNVLDDEPMPPVFVAVSVMLAGANILFIATAITYELTELLEVEAPVGKVVFSHDIPGVIPPLFDTVIVLAVVVSRFSVPGFDSTGGFPAFTVNVLERVAPAPFVADTVNEVEAIVVDCATVNTKPPTVTTPPAVMVVAVSAYVRPVGSAGIVQVIALRDVGLV
jgi:hypothetical protein